MTTEAPRVSVIIPVFNDEVRLRLCLTALTQQTYPADRYEIIVVDNNSDDDIPKVVAEFERVSLESEASPGSYAARNTGIAASQGEILAFTDSDCLPTPEWIEQGVKTLASKQADLVGGHITFDFSSKKTSPEIFDSITALQVKKNIETRQLTVTANLFTYRYVFDSIGLFDASLKSGGDFQWTKKATDAGFSLVYSARAEILHPARNLKSLIKKGYRVGAGQLQLLLDQRIPWSKIVLTSFRNFLPPSPWGYWQFICQTESDEARRRFIDMWLIAWVCNIASSAGRLRKSFSKPAVVNSNSSTLA